MAITDLSSITNLPPEGLPLREALALCPYWPEHKRHEIQRFHIRTGAIRATELSTFEKQQLMASGQAAWARVLEWLWCLLESKDWVLKACRSDDLQGEAKPFDRAVVRRLSFDADHDTVRGPNGQLFYGARIFSTVTMRVPKPDPQGIQIVGTVTVEGATPRKVERKDPAYYEDIRRVADELFPNGWQHERQVTILHEVGDATGHKRDVILRALGLRKT